MYIIRSPRTGYQYVEEEHDIMNFDFIFRTYRNIKVIIGVDINDHLFADNIFKTGFPVWTF